jgi:hypothetical protein
VQDIPFLAEQWFPTRSYLIDQGYPKAKVMAARRWEGPATTELQSRYGQSVGPREVAQPEQEVVQAYWVYYRYDSDGDGVTELHKILYCPGESGSQILENESGVRFVPYATGTPFLQPQRLDGLGVYDKLAMTELSKTNILRSWEDNLDIANNVRLAVNARTVNVEDAIDARPGGIIRVQGEPGTQVVWQPVIDVGGSAQAALDYQDRMRSERAGASLDLGSATAQVQAGSAGTAHGVERQISQREMLAAMMARTLAETLVRETYILVHRGLREWMKQPMRAKINGQITQVDPSQWPERNRVSVKTGLSVGERQQKRMALEQVIAQQEKLAAAGYDGVLVNAKGYHSAVMDWARAAQVDNGERYFLNPMSEESIKADKAKREESKRREGAQMEIAATAAAADQQKALIEQAMGKYKSDQEQAFKYWQESVRIELETLKEENQTLQTQILSQQGQGLAEQSRISAESAG